MLAQKAELQSLADELQTVQAEVKSSHTRIADLTLRNQGGWTPGARHAMSRGPVSTFRKTAGGSSGCMHVRGVRSNTFLWCQ